MPRPRLAVPAPVLAPTLAPVLALLLGGGCLAAAGCRPAGPERPPPNVLLVTVDTLRADHLSPYGSTGTRTPHAERLAAEGTLFQNAAAPMPTTRPSHATLFTGRYPRQHGVTDNHLVLPDDELTLAEVFGEAGYRTGAFVGASFLGRSSGISQGFETIGASRGRPPAFEVVERAIAWLRGLEPGERFFLWVHVFDPHMDYAPPKLFVPPPPAGGSDLAAVGWPTLRRLARRNGGDLDRSILERARQLYAAEVDAVDAALGVLLLELDERKLAADTVTVLTADHGECLEAGFFFRHGDCLRDGAVRVPLIVRYPGRVLAAERTAAPVEHLDVGPTLLALAGLEAPPSFGGRRLFGRDGGLVDADGEEAERYALVQLHVSAERLSRTRPEIWQGIESVAGVPMRPSPLGVEHLALRGARWKYVARSAGGEELYDLAEDPGETRDLAAEQPARVRELRAALRSRLAAMPLRVLDAGELSPELRHELEALGYL
jgi:choline-sulfatase